MEIQYPTDKLFITRPWVVVHDESVSQMVTTADKLKCAKGLVSFPTSRKIIRHKMSKLENRYTEIHTVELEQLPDLTVVMPDLLDYKDVLTSKHYFGNMSLSHCCEGDLHVLDDEVSGIENSLTSLIKEVAGDNELLLSFLLATKPTMTIQEILVYLEKYKRLQAHEEPKKLTLRNEIIFNNEDGTIKFNKIN